MKEDVKVALDELFQHVSNTKDFADILKNRFDQIEKHLLEGNEDEAIDAIHLLQDPCVEDLDTAIWNANSAGQQLIECIQRSDDEQGNKSDESRSN